MVRGGTYALVRRTAFRKALLAPWHPAVMETWLYVLAGAAQRTGVRVQHTMLCVTHQHTTVTVGPDANLPEFTEYLHREMSKALNVLMRSVGYEPPGQIFDGRQTSQMRLLDAAAALSHVMYERVNGVAAGLVRRPREMPGCRFDFGLWKGEPLVIRRPEFYFNPRTAEAERELVFEVDPLTYREFGGDIERIVHHARTTERKVVQALGRARSFPVLGAQRLRRIHPYNEPRTPRDPSREVVPTFKMGARGVTGRVARVTVCQEVSAFREGHRSANALRRAGEPALYPAGTYKMRVQHGVAVDDPDEHAILVAPGQTLAEVEAELEQSTEPRGAAPTDAADEVLEAFVREAGDVLESDRLQFGWPGHDDSGPNGGGPDGQDGSRGPKRRGVTIQHLSRTTREADTSRLVILRDHRRGRPRKPKGREPPR